jgi:iron(III) transport system substrate-binding protein
MRSLGGCWVRIAATAVWIAAAPSAEAALSVYCTHDPDACELAAKTFTRDTGIVVSMVRKPTGEVFAQLRAERDNPKSDVWYGGTFDSFLQGAAEGLFAQYRSPRLGELHPWAQRQASATGDRAVAIYRIIIGFGTNPTLLAKKKLSAPRCWSDLVKPEYKGEIELANPVTSGTGYTILSTLVTLYGEDGAFEFLKRMRPNVVRYTQSGTAQGPSVARGEVGVGVSFVHEFITQQLAGFPVDIAVPCEGTGRRARRHGAHRQRPQSVGGPNLLRLGPHKGRAGTREPDAQPDLARQSSRGSAARGRPVQCGANGGRRCGETGRPRGEEAPPRAVAARDRRRIELGGVRP